MVECSRRFLTECSTRDDIGTRAALEVTMGTSRDAAQKAGVRGLARTDLL